MKLAELLDKITLTKAQRITVYNTDLKPLTTVGQDKLPMKHTPENNRLLLSNVNLMTVSGDRITIIINH